MSTEPTTNQVGHYGALLVLACLGALIIAATAKTIIWILA